MKHLLLTTIAAVLLVGCGPSVGIHKATGTGNMEAVKKHLAAGTDVNAKDFGGGTPLHRATTKEIAELLIAKDADVNVKDKFGGTPLHNAAHRGRKEIAELLIDNGADLNVESYGETPLDTAINWKHPEIADLLRKHGGKTERELIAEAK